MTQLTIQIVPVTPFQQNCTLIFNNSSRKGVVIDPGGDLDRIEQAIESANVAIEQILITHGHIDHVGAAMALKRKLDVEIVGPHIADEPLCGGIEEQARMFGLEEGYENLVPDRWLEEGDIVTVGGKDFSVLHCPGHAPGHVIFHSAELRFAHVGDVLFRGSIGRTDLPGGDHATLIRSIKEKVLPLGDETGFICGHGLGSTFGQERQTNPFLV